MTWSAKSEPCVPCAGADVESGRQQPDRRRQDDERNQEGPDRALAVAHQQDEERDAEHPAEERDRAAESPVGHGAEGPRARREGRGTGERVPRRPGAGVSPRQSFPRRDEGPDRRGLRGHVAGHREPPERWEAIRRPDVTAGGGRNTIAGWGISTVPAEFSARRRLQRAASTPSRSSSARASARSGGFPSRSASSSSRCCATATASASRRTTCGRWPPGSRGPSAPTRSRSSSRASSSRTSPACRCSSISRRCARRSPRLGRDPKVIEPLVPVDLVVDHSVQVDEWSTPDALEREHADRVRAQPRALRVPEVGHAGLPRLRGRAARASASSTRSTSNTSRRASSRRTASTIPTRSSAPTRTRR